MLDKRMIMRDMRSAHRGLSRRIRLRTRTTTPTAASVDPLVNAAANPSTDTLFYMSGQFNLLKSTQDYDLAGAVQQERAVVYFHAMYKSQIEDSYSMYIGGTGKEWTRVSSVMYDDGRMSLKVIVQAVQ